MNKWFLPGDIVRWPGKVGKVVFEVPENTALKDIIEDLDTAWGLSEFSHAPIRQAIRKGVRRSHKSYLVVVEPRRDGKPKLYWPRVSALEPAGGGDDE